MESVFASLFKIAGLGCVLFPDSNWDIYDFDNPASFATSFAVRPSVFLLSYKYLARFGIGFSLFYYLYSLIYTPHNK